MIIKKIQVQDQNRFLAFDNNSPVKITLPDKGGIFQEGPQPSVAYRYDLLREVTKYSNIDGTPYQDANFIATLSQEEFDAIKNFE